MKKLLRALSLVLCLTSCRASNDETDTNHCEKSADCPDDARCDRELSLCVVTRTKTPYQVVLQVSDVPSGLTRFTFPAFELEESLERDLAVPAGMTLLGSIAHERDMSGDTVSEPVRAEVAFQPLPEEIGFPVAPVVVTSRGTKGEDASNLYATLAPNRTYEVSVLPLGDDSTLYPPLRVRYRADESAPRFALTYRDGDLKRLALFLLDERSNPQKGRWVRIRNKTTRQVVSSTTVVADDGRFALQSLLDIEGDPEAYYLEVNVDASNPWAETITVYLSEEALLSDVITIPAVPERVSFRGSVEADMLADVPLADLTFVSKFELPDEVGDVRDRDWCRFRLPSPAAPAMRPEIACEANVSTSTDTSGAFSVELLPGSYDVFISPSLETKEVARAATTKTTATIETQPGGIAQEGQAYALERASVYRGSVIGLHTLPVPNASIRVLALGLAGTLGEVAAYNRSSDTLTDEGGLFSLGVDTGYFDLAAEPPEDSGYPRMYIANRLIQRKEMRVIDISRFKLLAPLVMRGRVTAGGEMAPGARIEAYAIVKRIDGGSRGVLIGTTTADAEGRYVLKLTPRIEDGVEATGGAGM